MKLETYEGLQHLTKLFTLAIALCFAVSICFLALLTPPYFGS